MIKSEYIRKGRTVKSLKPKYDLIQVIDADTGFITEVNRNVLRRDFKDYELIAVTNFSEERVTVVVLKEKPRTRILTNTGEVITLKWARKLNL